MLLNFPPEASMPLTLTDDQSESLKSLLQRQLEQLQRHEIDAYLDLRVAVTSGADLQDEALDDQLTEDSVKVSRFSTRTDALLSKNIRKAYILGASGSGKTVTLASLARRLVRDALDSLENRRQPDWLPLFWSAARLPEDENLSPVSLLTGMLENLGVYQSAGELAGLLLQSSSLVLLLDGVQEVSYFRRGQFRNVQHLLRCRDLKVIATTRPGYPLENIGPSLTLHLQVLDPSERALILRQRRVSREGAARLDKLALHRRLRRGLAIPQLWQMAIALAETDLDLMEVASPTSLYQCFLEQTLASQLQRQKVGEGPPYSDDEVLSNLELLGAACTLTGGQSLSVRTAVTLVERWVVGRGEALNVCYSADWARRFVDDLPRFYQPLLEESETGERVSFTHGSFAEFLAARWLLRLRPVTPEALLGFHEIADVLLFHSEIQESHVDDQKVLTLHDSQRLRFGSTRLVMSWLADAERQRVEAVTAALVHRLSNPLGIGEPKEILRTLKARGQGWARWLLSTATPDGRTRATDFIFRELAQTTSRSRRDRKREEARKERLAREKAKTLRRARRRDKAGTRKDLSRLSEKLAKATDDYGRSKLLERIAALGVSGSAEGILPCLGSHDSHVRRAAAQALGALRDRSTANDLAPLLHDPDSYVRSAATLAAGQLGDRLLVESVRKNLHDPSEYVVSAACVAVGVLGGPGDAESLVLLLDHKNPMVRGSALKSLGFLGASKTKAAVRKSLDPRREPDVQNRTTAAKAAGFLRDDKAVVWLRVMMERDPDPYAKSAAADSLGLLGAFEAVGSLSELLDSKDSFNKSSAARALGLIGNEQSVLRLLPLVDPASEADGVVRGSAATALGQLGDPRAVDALIASLDPSHEENGAVRGSAATALGQLGDPRAVDALIASLDPSHEERGDARGSAATALGQLGDQRAVVYLKKSAAVTREPNPVVRLSALAATRSLARLKPVGRDSNAEKLERVWKELLEDFYLQTASPPAQSLVHHLERCLVDLERWFGGYHRRGWKEKDYQRVLVALLATDARFQVLEEVVPADRQRLDLLLETAQGRREQAVLELKLFPLVGRRDDYRHTDQVTNYVRSLAQDRSVHAHLILLDPSLQPDWGEAERRSETEGVTVWRVAVGRQPPSKRVPRQET